MAYWWGRRHGFTPSTRSSKEGTKDTEHKHADDRADGPVVVDDRGPIQRIPADRVLALRVALDDLGLLLARAVGDNFRALGHLPHDLVGDDVHRKLRVAERVRRALDRDERRPQGFRDLAARIQHLDDDLAHALIFTFRVEDLVQRIVGVLLLRRRVEGRAGRAIGVAALRFIVSRRWRRLSLEHALTDAARCLPHGERLPSRISCGLQRRSAADGQR